MSIDYTNIPSPCFVLNEDALRKNLALIKGVADEAGVQIILAFKGFAMWGAFPIVREYLSGATASSLYEARLCQEEMGVKAHLYAPAYLEEEFKELLPLSSHITFNSHAQYEKFHPVIKDSGLKISSGLRINPEYSDVETALYNPASPDSRLGMTAPQLKSGLPEGIDGLHAHVLCESDSFALEKVLLAIEKKFGHLLPHLKWLNLGGGHLITREGYDVDHLVALLNAFKTKYKLHIILEPGSAIAWETGDLVSSVLDIVENGGVKTAILDVSFTCHMPDTLEMPYRPNIIGAEKDVSAAGEFLYNLGGTSCLAGDYLKAYQFKQPLRVGDRVIFQDMMHYTMVKTTTFNGVKHPSIGIWTAKQQFKLIRQFGYEDYKNRLS